MKFGILILALFPITVFAAEFSIGNTKVASSITEKIVECGDYQVLLKHDYFPLEYENEIPEKFQINGFFGSKATIGKTAILLPSNSPIPQPENINTLKDNYPEERVYLASNATCKGHKLIISYWSGGNCEICETFVQFNVQNGKAKNAKRVTYSEVRELIK